MESLILLTLPFLQMNGNGKNNPVTIICAISAFPPTASSMKRTSRYSPTTGWLIGK
jgi:hypothetical protein